jgi:hypothetical protein
MKKFSTSEYLKEMDRKDWATAQSITTFGMNPKEKKPMKKDPGNALSGSSLEKPQLKMKKQYCLCSGVP